MGKDVQRLVQEKELNQGLGNRKKSPFRTVRGFRKIGDKENYFRSRWEINYALYLQYLKEKEAIADWFFEPQTFWFLNIKRGVRSYLPDFKIIETNGKHRWIEVKGYMDAKSKTKIKRFKKYYPSETLEIIDGEWFKANKDLKLLIPAWES